MTEVTTMSDLEINADGTAWVIIEHDDNAEQVSIARPDRIAADGEDVRLMFSTTFAPSKGYPCSILRVTGDRNQLECYLGSDTADRNPDKVWEVNEVATLPAEKALWEYYSG